MGYLNCLFSKHIQKQQNTKWSIKLKKMMQDPYIDELKDEFQNYSNQLKKLKKKLLKTQSQEIHRKIIKQIDSIAKKMENNQKQATKVTKSRIKERKLKSKR